MKNLFTLLFTLLCLNAHATDNFDWATDFTGTFTCMVANNADIISATITTAESVEHNLNKNNNKNCYRSALGIGAVVVFCGGKDKSKRLSMNLHLDQQMNVTGEATYTDASGELLNDVVINCSRKE